jgi:hypothetical protein
MPTSHTVQQGDSVISLSEQHGLFAMTIWDDGANAALREKRQDMNVLLPGDVVVIPDKRPRSEKRAAGASYSFRRKGVPALFRLQLYDMHLPRANQAYELKVDGKPYSGTTDGNGVLQQYLPTGSRSGELLLVEADIRIALQFGHLDPADELSGVQNRLRNLGHECGSADGVMNDATRAALLRFQYEQGLEESGEADAATRERLRTIHDADYTHPTPGGAA